MENSREILVRDPENFPEALKMTLNTLTINESPQVVGSAAYLNHKYPSDVDVFEKVTVRLSREEALKFYANQFQNIMQKVIVEATLFYLDFKAGEDYRFDLPIPQGDTQFDILSRREIAHQLHRQNLLTAKENDSLRLAAGDYEQFREGLRQKRVLRWTPEEVLLGYKNLSDNRYITLTRALDQPSLVKLDTVTWIQGRFQSVEVFYNLRYIQPNTTEVIELYPLGSYRDNLIADIEKYSSTAYYNPLKVSKRLWALARIQDCSELIRALNPLIGSDVAALNQVNADAEILMAFLERSFILPETGPLNAYDYHFNFQTVSNLFMELLGFQKRIANHLDGPIFTTLSSIIDQFFDVWLEWQRTGMLNREAIIVRLQQIHQILYEEILQKSIVFLNKLDQMHIVCSNSYFKPIAGINVRSPYQ